jgi:hypothetical protein
LAAERADAATQTILDKLCGEALQVVGGPFVGLPYLAFASGSGLLPKIVGCYEAELHPIVDLVCRRGYDRLIDIGSGEGYYVAGFGRALPNLEIVAVDTDPLARARLKQLVQRNGLTKRVRRLASIDNSRLDREIKGRALIWSDCEGFEDDLLRPELSPGLRRTDVLVETHEFLRPGVVARLIERFASSHSITRIPMAPRDVRSFPALARLTDSEQARALDEGRPQGMEWLWFESKERA